MSLRLQHGKVLNVRQELLCAFSLLTCLDVLPLTARMKVPSLGPRRPRCAGGWFSFASFSDNLKYIVGYCWIMLVESHIPTSIQNLPIWMANMTCLAVKSKDLQSLPTSREPHYLDTPWDPGRLCVSLFPTSRRNLKPHNMDPRWSKFLPRIKYSK